MDLTQLMCEEKKLELDVAGFNAKMEEEKELSQAARKAKMSGGSGKEMVLEAEQTAAFATRGVGTTDDSAKYVWDEDVATEVTACCIGRNETEDKTGFKDKVAKEDKAVGIIVKATNFYAEQGGQIYDTGTIKCSKGTVRVDAVQVYGGFILHLGEVTSGTVSVGDAVTLTVDYVRRRPIASNHTMTHVLNFALRDVLIGKEGVGAEEGLSIDQKGSLVDEDKLR